MSDVPLDDAETRVIFADEALSTLDESNGSDQRDVLNRLETIASRVVSSTHLVYERIGNVDVIRANDRVRVYSRVVPNLPPEETAYHVVYVLFVDRRHQYDRGDLVTFDRQAEAKLQELTAIGDRPDLEEYFAAHDALTPEDLRDMLG